MLSSAIAVFARAISHFFRETSPSDHTRVHLDTILVIVRYSTICFDNRDFTKHLNRTMNMLNTYTEYLKLLKKKTNDPVLIADDAHQLILHRFPSTISANSTCMNHKIDFLSEIAMCVFLDRVCDDIELYSRNDNEINTLAEEVYRSISII